MDRWWVVARKRLGKRYQEGRARARSAQVHSVQYFQCSRALYPRMTKWSTIRTHVDLTYVAHPRSYSRWNVGGVMKAVASILLFSDPNSSQLRTKPRTIKYYYMFYSTLRFSQFLSVVVIQCYHPIHSSGRDSSTTGIICNFDSTTWRQREAAHGYCRYTVSDTLNNCDKILTG